MRMKQSEAKRTIMLATQLAAAKHRARVANLDLKMMVDVMSFGQAVELMARRPGLELVDNEGDRWRVSQCELQMSITAGIWDTAGIYEDWNLLTFRIAQ